MKTISRPPTDSVCGNCCGRGATVSSSGDPASRAGIVHDDRACPICGGSGHQTDAEYVAYLDREIGTDEADRLLARLGRPRLVS